MAKKDKKPRIKLIINPNADMGNAWKHAWSLHPIVSERADADWAGTVYPTHAIELAKQAAKDGYDIVVAIGGDGTVHEVVNGLMQVKQRKRPKLGIVPMGSGNDFAWALGLPEKPEDALHLIVNGATNTRLVDIGQLEDDHGRKEYWNNSLSVGFGGAVSIYSHNLPILRGFAMYFVAVIQTIIRRYDVLGIKITTDQASWQDELMMLAVCNGPREGGGFITAPDAIVDDGVFNFTAVKKMPRLMMFRMIPEFMKGTHGRFKQIHMGELKTMTVESDHPLYMHIDGELFTDFSTDIQNLKIEIIPKALEVIVSSNA